MQVKTSICELGLPFILLLLVHKKPLCFCRCLAGPGFLAFKKAFYFRSLSFERRP
jgi:hypothetical protein